FLAVPPFEAMNPGDRQSERSEERVDCIDLAAGDDGHRAAARLEKGFERAPCAILYDHGLRRFGQLCESAVKIEKESVCASFAQERQRNHAQSSKTGVKDSPYQLGNVQPAQLIQLLAAGPRLERGVCRSFISWPKVCAAAGFV